MPANCGWVGAAGESAAPAVPGALTSNSDVKAPRVPREPRSRLPPSPKFVPALRDAQAPPDFFDGLQLLLVISALVVDGVALAAIAARISEFGFTPNRVAALGENLILLVNLVWSAWLYMRFVRRRGSFAVLERWQVAYLPVYAVWAAFVVMLFTPLFGYR